MDLSAIIVIIVLSALFFGFIVWMAFHSRKSDSETPSNDTGEITFSKTGSKNE